MRHYETAFLVAPNLPDEEAEALIDQMAAIVSKNKGKMEKIDNWGKRKMAYQIQKFDEAIYVFFHYQGTPEIPAELERQFKQKEAVIRYLTLKKDLRENIRNKKKPVSKRAPRRRPSEDRAPSPKREDRTPAAAPEPAPTKEKEAPPAKPEEAPPAKPEETPPIQAEEAPAVPKEEAAPVATEEKPTAEAESEEKE